MSTTKDITRDATIATPLGKVRIHAHNALSFYIGAGTRYDGDASEPININGVAYRMSGQIALIPGQGWQWNGGGYSKGPDINRSGTFKVDDWTWPAKRKAEKVLLEAASAWADSPEGREVLAQGERDDVDTIRERYQETIATLEQALTDTRYALAALDSSNEKPAAYPEWRVERRKP